MRPDDYGSPSWIRMIQGTLINLLGDDPTFYNGVDDEEYPKEDYARVTGRTIREDALTMMSHLRRHVANLEEIR